MGSGNVPVKGGRVSQTLVAMGTGILFVQLVDRSDVIGELALPAEPLLTMGAFMWFFPLVDALDMYS